VTRTGHDLERPLTGVRVTAARWLWPAVRVVASISIGTAQVLFGGQKKTLLVGLSHGWELSTSPLQQAFAFVGYLYGLHGLLPQANLRSKAGGAQLHLARRQATRVQLADKSAKSGIGILRPLADGDLGGLGRGLVVECVAQPADQGAVGQQAAA